MPYTATAAKPASPQRQRRDSSPSACPERNRRAQNDRWGHGAGDRVLRDLAEIIRQEARASDICARYGGDEFILLMPRTRTDEAVILLDRLRKRAGTIFVPAGQITISCGAAEWAGHPDETPQDILRRVDAALYDAKRVGRDRVAVNSVGQVAG